MAKFWKTEIPTTDFYAVLFLSTRSKNLDGYAEMDEKTIEKVKLYEGFLGYESIKSGDDGIFISYWADMESIERWKKDSLHMEAKNFGYAKWYDRLVTQICKVNYSKEFIR
ncbi:MAG TPA: DUF4188 domain-containing protein [Flavobacteriales bacterium]|nr:DUF4188 domain-containing protein [Flavobacteriales bacterium]